MEKSEIAIFLFSTTLVLFILIFSMFYVIKNYKSKKQEHLTEIEEMQKDFEKNILLAETETQQSMMRQIGEELHDTVGQRLTLAYLQVQNLMHTITDPKMVATLQTHNNNIQTSLQDIRNISKLLNNETLQNHGFAQAIQQELTRVKDAGICNTFFQQTGARFLLPNRNADLILLGICREFIQNSLKHAKAKNIWVYIENYEPTVKLIFKDDGQGFDVEKMLSISNGQGLNNIENRAALLKGKTLWESTLQQGTTLTLIINKLV